MAKVAPKSFKLTTVAGRFGLLGGITAGTVGLSELQHAMVEDTEKRPYRKPVVAAGKRYASIVAAAEALVAKSPGLRTRNQHSRQVDAMQHRIARYCNADNVKGYYWSN